MSKKKVTVGQDAAGNPIEIEFDLDDRFVMNISFERVQREGDDDDMGKGKGSLTSSEMDFGGFVAAQGLVVDLLKEMNGWGREAAKALGVAVPGTLQG